MKDLKLRKSKNGFKDFLKGLIVFLLFTVGLEAKAQWIAINSGIVDPTAAYALATDGANLYGGVADSASGGAYISTDMGNSWTAINAGLPSLNVWCLATSGSNVYAGVFGYGIYLSTDYGSSWVAINSGLTNYYISTIIVKDTTLYAGTISGGIFKASITSASYNWTAINSGLSSLDVKAIAINGNNDLFAGTHPAGGGSGGVYLSADDGGSWTQINSGFSDLYARSLICHDSIILAGMGMSTLPTMPDVFLSGNTGASWTSSGMAGTEIVSFHKIYNTIFAGSADGSLYYSNNNGATWLSWSTGLVGADIFSQTSIGSTLFLATYGGGFYKRSTDQLIGINEIKESTDFILYPNPANGIIQIKADQQINAVQITDVFGRRMSYFEIKKAQAEIDISGFTDGIYFIRLNDSKGNTLVKKVVKQ